MHYFHGTFPAESVQLKQEKTICPNTYTLTSFICERNIFLARWRENSNHHVIDYCDSRLITNTERPKKTRSTEENLIHLPTSSNCHTNYVITAYDTSIVTILRSTRERRISKPLLIYLVFYRKPRKKSKEEQSGSKFTELIWILNSQVVNNVASKD